MAWQDQFLRYFGPGFLSGIPLSTWVKLLVQNRFRVNPRSLGRCGSITCLSMCNSVLRLNEVLRYGHRIRRQDVPAPVFIIGHWRSGTTHLHRLFCVDDRFAYPTIFDVSFPHSFLSAKLPQLLEFFLPAKRWQDNMANSSRAPAEDECALSQLSGLSSQMGEMFPRNIMRYDRYLSFRKASRGERKRWQQTLLEFVKKLHVADQRLLILKSPHHTARIPLILDVFPNARFVHIRRNPWNVLKSNQSMWQSLMSFCCLQKLSKDEIDAVIIRRYKELYDCFFEDRGMIPAGQLFETSYEQVVEQPAHEMQAIYEALDLPAFDHVRAPLGDFLATIAGYQTNRHLDIPQQLQETVLHEWKHVFDEWDYPRSPNPTGSAA